MIRDLWRRHREAVATQTEDGRVANRTGATLATLALVGGVVLLIVGATVWPTAWPWGLSLTVGGVGVWLCLGIAWGLHLRYLRLRAEGRW